MLLEHRKIVKQRIDPPKVKMATEGYRKKNDIYRQFIEECIIDDAKAKISLLELYTAFKEWFKERKVDVMTLHVYPSNKEAISLYKKFGFKEYTLNLGRKL